MRPYSRAAGPTLLFGLALALSGCGGGGGGGGGNTDTVDTTAPTVASTSPASNASDVAINTTVSITFSEAMDCATITTSSFTLKDAGNNAISGSVTCSGTGATFMPAANLAYTTVHTATVTTAVTDSAGNTLAADHTWSFTIGEAPDTTPPTVSSVSPAAGAVDVAPVGAIAVTFSEAVDCTTISAATFTLKDATDTSITGSVACADSNASFTPELGFPEGATLTTTLTTAVADSAGNPLASAFSSSFTTRSRAWGSADLLEQHASISAMRAKIAAAPDGTAIAVWDEDSTPYDIWATRYTPGAGWSDPQVIDTDGVNDAYDARVFMDANGNAFVAWNQWEGGENIWVRRYTPTGGWGTAERLETGDGDALEPFIAFDADGNALAVWGAVDGANQNIWSRYYTAGGTWGTPTLVETDITGQDSEPTATFVGDGTAVIVWNHYEASRDSLWSAIYTPGGTCTAPFPLEDDETGGAYAAPIATDPNGNAMVVWHQYDGTNYPIWSRRYLPGNGWGAAQLVTTGGAGISGTVLPAFAFDAHGNAVAVWPQYTGATFDLMASRYTADDAWDTPVLIDNLAPGVSGQQVAIDGYGNVLALWVQDNKVVANRYTAASGWGTAAAIESAGGAQQPQLALDARGDAFAVWYRADGAYFSVMFNRFE